MIQLDVISGSHRGASFKVEEPSFIIGRARTNRIILFDNKISARHAEIHCRGDQYVLSDLGSTNGTFVNGKAVTKAPLKAGDEVRLGSTVLQVVAIFVGPAAARPRVSLSDAGAGRSAPVQARVRRESAATALQQSPEEAHLPTLVEAYHNLLAMYKVSSIIRSNVETDRLLEEVLAQVLRNSRAERAVIMLFDDESGELVARAFRSRREETGDPEMTISRTIVNQVIEKQEGLLTTDASLDERFKPGESIIQQDIRSAMCAPLASKNRVMGIIYVDCRHEVGTFKKADLELLTAVANEAGIAIENQILREANVKAERLAAVGQTVSSLSHHIKNILSCMQAGSEIVDHALAEDDVGAIRKGWGIVNRNERKIAELVLNMLNYSADRVPVKVACDLNNVIEDVAEMVRPAALAAGVRLELRLDPALPSVPADLAGVHRVILNLLTNALDAVEGCDGPLVALSTAREGESAVVRVADNGAGVPEEIREKIFDVFFSTKGERGTGLGLAVVKKIVNEHAGEVSVGPRAGGGAEFRVALSIHPPDSDPADSDPADSDPADSDPADSDPPDSHAPDSHPTDSGKRA